MVDRKSKSMLNLPLTNRGVAELKPFAMELPALVKKSISWIEKHGSFIFFHVVVIVIVAVVVVRLKSY